MNALAFLILAIAPFSAGAQNPGQGLGVHRAAQQNPESARPEAQQAVPRPEGGLNGGADQPYSEREASATDLESFAGGKQVVFIAPYDIFVLIVIVTVVVVLVVVL